MILDKKIQVFLTVADVGSFSQASRQLSLSQSVISFHIDALEKELGVTLFRRQGRSISLTTEGIILYEEGKKIAQRVRRLEGSFSSHSQKIARMINLAGDALTCSFSLPWVVTAFRKKNPDVVFTYKHLITEEIIERLLANELDMGLVGHPVQNRKLIDQVCFNDEIILATNSENTSIPNIINVDDLKEIPLLWVTGDRGLELTVTRTLLENGFPVKNLNILMEVEDLPILKTFIQAGLGVAFLPKISIENELAIGMAKEVKIRNVELQRRTHILVKKEKHIRELVIEFIHFIQQFSWADTERTRQIVKKN